MATSQRSSHHPAVSYDSSMVREEDRRRSVGEQFCDDDLVKSQKICAQLEKLWTAASPRTDGTVSAYVSVILMALCLLALCQRTCVQMCNLHERSLLSGQYLRLLVCRIQMESRTWVCSRTHSQHGSLSLLCIDN